MHLPVGVSNFRALIENQDPNQEGYLFIDKTLLIKELIYDLTPVIVLTRPRRFGKTLNISMLRHFFAAEVNGKPTRDLFTGLKITNEPICMKEQGQYPVIFITFKDAKYKTFNLCFDHIKKQIANVYSEYRFLLESEKLDPEDRVLFEQILEKKAEQVDWHECLKSLTVFIYKATGQQAIILIDEYDTPIQEAYLNSYYDDLIAFMRNLFSSSLKDNDSLKRAVLTGILRVSKESLFSGLSNVKVYSVLDQNYCSYFGFTEAEVNELLYKAQLPNNATQTKEWYNGYNFGSTTIYNPWSIINFIKDEGKRLKSYWINTSGNDLVKNIIIKSSFNVQEKIAELITGRTIKEYIDENIVFTDLEKNSDAIWGLLLMSGYLKYVSFEDQGRRSLCELKLPNNEVEDFYTSVVEEWITGDRGFNWYIDFITDLKEGRVAQFEEKLQTLVEETLSYHDVSKKSQESFYHGLMLAFVTGLKKTHVISSNKESGSGRYDIALIPFDPSKLGIIMEFKAVDDQVKLIDTASDALVQIKASKYSTELKSKGITNICAMGISFSGKAIKIKIAYV